MFSGNRLSFVNELRYSHQNSIKYLEKNSNNQDVQHCVNYLKFSTSYCSAVLCFSDHRPNHEDYVTIDYLFAY